MTCQQCSQGFWSGFFFLLDVTKNLSVWTANSLDGEFFFQVGGKNVLKYIKHYQKSVSGMNTVYVNTKDTYCMVLKLSHIFI